MFHAFLSVVIVGCRRQQQKQQQELHEQHELHEQQEQQEQQKVAAGLHSIKGL